MRASRPAAARCIAAHAKRARKVDADADQTAPVDDDPAPAKPKRATKKAAAVEDEPNDEASAEAATGSAPKAKRASKKAATSVAAAAEDAAEAKPKRTRKKAEAASDDEAAGSASEAEEPVAEAKPKRTRKKAVSEDGEAPAAEAKPKAKRASKKKEVEVDDGLPLIASSRLGPDGESPGSKRASAAAGRKKRGAPTAPRPDLNEGADELAALVLEEDADGCVGCCILAAAASDAVCTRTACAHAHGFTFCRGRGVGGGKGRGGCLTCGSSFSFRGTTCRDRCQGLAVMMPYPYAPSGVVGAPNTIHWPMRACWVHTQQAGHPGRAHPAGWAARLCINSRPKARVGGCGLVHAFGTHLPSTASPLTL